MALPTNQKTVKLAVVDIAFNSAVMVELPMPTAVALIYNWWSLFERLANPKARREAITSRPWLMSSVGRRTEHAGQTTITLTGQHADFGKARAALMYVSALLQEWVVRARSWG
jgi:hypothetical protein